jgi:hypothetical protein
MLRICFSSSALGEVARAWWTIVSESFVVAETRSAWVWVYHQPDDAVLPCYLYNKRILCKKICADLLVEVMRNA